MRVDLVRNGLTLRRPWTILFGGEAVPVRWSTWYRQSWMWPSGESYLMDMQGEITIFRGAEEVARRNRTVWQSHRGSWEGIIPLTYTWRHCSVWFRSEADKLMMLARSRCLLGPHALVIRDSVGEESLPVLYGIAMATFLNYDG